MKRNVYPKIKNVIFLCLLLMAIQIALGLLIGVAPLYLKFSHSSAVMGILLILSSIISFGIVTFIGFKKTKLDCKEIFKLNNASPFMWVSITVFTIGMTIVMSELNNLLNYFLPVPEMFRDFLGAIINEQAFVIAFIHIGVVAALTEEFFFRGLILSGLSRSYSKKKAAIASALLFGVVHLNPWQFFSAFIVGIILAWICIKTKSLWLCIFVHFFYNALYTISMRHRELIPIKAFNSSFDSAADGFQPFWFTLLGALIFFIGFYMLVKGMKRIEAAA